MAAKSDKKLWPVVAPVSRLGSANAGPVARQMAHQAARPAPLPVPQMGMHAVVYPQEPEIRPQHAARPAEFVAEDDPAVQISMLRAKVAHLEEQLARALHNNTLLSEQLVEMHELQVRMTHSQQVAHIQQVGRSDVDERACAARARQEAMDREFAERLNAELNK